MQPHRHISVSGATRNQSVNGTYELKGGRQPSNVLYECGGSNHKLFLVRSGTSKHMWVVGDDPSKKQAYAISDSTTLLPHEIKKGGWKEFDGKQFTASPSLVVQISAKPVKIVGCHRQPAVNGDFVFSGKLHDDCPVWNKQAPKALSLFRHAGTWCVGEKVGSLKGWLLAKSTALSPVDVKDWTEFDGRVFVKSHAISVSYQKGQSFRMNPVPFNLGRQKTGTFKFNTSTLNVGDANQPTSSKRSPSPRQPTTPKRSTTPQPTSSGSNPTKLSPRNNTAKSSPRKDPAKLSPRTDAAKSSPRNGAAKLSPRNDAAKLSPRQPTVPKNAGTKPSPRQPTTPKPNVPTPKSSPRGPDASKNTPKRPTPTTTDLSANASQAEPPTKLKLEAAPAEDKPRSLFARLCCFFKPAKKLSTTTEQTTAPSAVPTHAPPTCAPWSDPQFPPNNKSVFITGKVTNPALVVSSWRRPSQWASNPGLFVNGVDAGDVTQGSLGDCWFISAASVVGTRPNLIRDLFVEFQGDNAVHRSGLAPDGKYTVRIFKNGRWHNVTVDDRFPCGRDGLPLFGRNQNPNDLWVLLLEKAYAKLHGHYEALEGGTIDQGLSDLTGGLCLEFDFTHEPVLQKIKSKELWNDMVTWGKEGHLMGISLSGDGRETETPQGLFVNHAYGILSVANKKGFRLVQIRNPWGKQEWRGDWGDSSDQWKQHPDLAKELGQQSNDGKFWMSFEDMTTYFNVLHVCKLFDKTWERQEFGGKFTAANFGGSPFQGGWSWRIGPQYTITSKKSFRCLVHLQQPDSRVKEGQEHYEQSLGFGIFALNPQFRSKSSNRMLAFGKDDVFYRHQPTLARVVSDEIEFPAGTYAILPYSLKLTGRHLEYVLTLTTPTSAKVSANEVDDQDLFVYQISGGWDKNTAGGGPNLPSWNKNPMFPITIPSDCEVVFVLKPNDPATNAMVLIEDEHNKPERCAPVAQSNWGVQESYMSFSTPKGEPRYLLLVPFLQEANRGGQFELTVFTEKPLKVKDGRFLPVGAGVKPQTASMDSRKSTLGAFGRVGRLRSSFRKSVRFVG